ncbi:MAG TPA: HprK-related kinase A [Burkholderiales bacterium]|nr:HprK-related kinase A [Burkholderiales bacterium]
MRRLNELAPDQLRGALQAEGIGLSLGTARVHIRSDVPALAPALARVYGQFPVEEPSGFFDVAPRLELVRRPGQLFRAQLRFFVDGEVPFELFPGDTHLPLLEWGLNWCLADRSNHKLLLHAGVVEKNGRAAILPALPGSGKSTLTAALSARGFRLLSDEFGVLDPMDGTLRALLRPIALKNESIEVIRRFHPDAVLGPRFPKTRKGDVAHMAPDRASVDRRDEPAVPHVVLFPAYEAGAATVLEELPPARCFAKLSTNSFNYEVLGPAGFRAVTRLVESTRGYSLRYSTLEEAVERVQRLFESER